jgi:hypothetical protein
MTIAPSRDYFGVLPKPNEYTLIKIESAITRARTKYVQIFLWFGQFHLNSETHKVARFFLVRHAKAGKYNKWPQNCICTKLSYHIPNVSKLLEMVIKYTK